jgi:hypothetical protein
MKDNSVIEYPLTCCGVRDVCVMIQLTMRGVSSALYTQNGGVIFIHNMTEEPCTAFNS